MKTILSPCCAVLAALCAALLGMGGCQRDTAAADAKPAAGAGAAQATFRDNDTVSDDGKKAGEGGEVTLSPEQMQRIGLQTAAATPAQFGDEATGYGSVMLHDSIAQGLAELISAQATEQQSRAALARARRLSGTAGAMSADTVEADARQAAVDAAALTLARQRLSAVFGLKPPWSDGGDSALLRGLADGNPKLVRLTFPLGALSTDTPKSLFAARIGAAAATRWKMTTVWSAPADANLPGRSFFAILRGADVGEGERILVWAPMGAAESGVIVARSAVVISDGKYWFYLEEKPGTFARMEIDPHKPLEGGYFLSEGVQAGDKVVIKGAAQLLAQEANSGGDAN